MKAKLTRDMDGPNPKFDRSAEAAARKAGKAYPEKRTVGIPAGTVIDHPQAWLLVRQGCAVPDDAECEAAAGMTAGQIEKAAAAYAKLDAGMATGDPALDAEPKDPAEPEPTGKRRRS